MSRFAGSLGRDPLGLSPRTPGPLGCKDAGDPDASLKLGDTPGSLGRNDCGDADADAPYGLGPLDLHMTLSWDSGLLIWDYDPDRLLQDDRLNPLFAAEAHGALKAAVSAGLRPKVHEAYRSPEESERRWQKYKSGTGHRAAGSWQSVHNYGLAMDVWLYDSKGRQIEPPQKGWYGLYKRLAKAAPEFFWGEPFDDADHFEYHPNWRDAAKGTFLISVRKWALQAADANGKTGDSGWLPYFWWAAGAQGDAPPDSYLASQRPPIQG